MTIEICNPTGRKTEAHIVTIGDHELFFSYKTLIAYRGPSGRWRIANFWGPTTGRHFNELGCSNFSLVGVGKFEPLVMTAIMNPQAVAA